MPKQIQDLKENILRCAKKCLLRGGLDALTIRAVASECGVAVGTVYNYYPSKDMLAASVMLEDWLEALGRMESRCTASADPVDGMREIYDAIRDFAGIYSGTWHTYSVRNGYSRENLERHGQLIGQISGILRSHVLREENVFCDFLPDFLAETILSAASAEKADFEKLVPILQKLLQ